MTAILPIDPSTSTVPTSLQEKKSLSQSTLYFLFSRIKEHIEQIPTSPRSSNRARIEAIEALFNPCEFYQLNVDEHRYDIISRIVQKNLENAKCILDSMASQKSILFIKASIKVHCHEKERDIEKINSLIFSSHFCNHAYFQLCTDLIFAKQAFQKDRIEEATHYIKKAETRFEKMSLSPRQNKLKPLALLKIAAQKAKMLSFANEVNHHVTEALQLLSSLKNNQEWGTDTDHNDNQDWETHTKSVRILVSFDLQTAKELCKKMPEYVRAEPLMIIVMEEAKKAPENLLATITMTQNPYLQSHILSAILIKYPNLDISEIIQNIGRTFASDPIYEEDSLINRIQQLQWNTKFKTCLEKIKEVISLCPLGYDRQKLEMESLIMLMRKIAEKILLKSSLEWLRAYSQFAKNILQPRNESK